VLKRSYLYVFQQLFLSIDGSVVDLCHKAAGEYKGEFFLYLVAILEVEDQPILIVVSILLILLDELQVLVIVGRVIEVVEYPLLELFLHGYELPQLFLLPREVAVLFFGVLLKIVLFFEGVDDEAQHVGYLALQKLFVC
jgi:hypothetical protein